MRERAPEDGSGEKVENESSENREEGSRIFTLLFVSNPPCMAEPGGEKGKKKSLREKSCVTAKKGG